jgi:hypothetical protein
MTKFIMESIGLAKFIKGRLNGLKRISTYTVCSDSIVPSVNDNQFSIGGCRHVDSRDYDRFFDFTLP